MMALPTVPRENVYVYMNTLLHSAFANFADCSGITSGREPQRSYPTMISKT
jgi:hypothetical protein